MPDSPIPDKDTAPHHPGPGSRPLTGQTFRIVEATFTALKAYPLDAPFQDSSMGPFSTFSFAILSLRDEDGCSCEVPLSSSSLPVLENILLPHLFGGRRMAYEELFHSMYWAIRNEGFRSTHVAGPLGLIDLALYGIAATRERKALHHFLGAERDWTSVYVSGGGTNLSEKALIEEAESFVRTGFTCIKIKVGKNFGTSIREDEHRVKAVRDRIGSTVGLAVDANQVWTAADASRFIRSVRDENICWIEEPVHSADLTGMRILCADSSIPVAMGESEVCGHVFPSLVEAGVTHLQPSIGHMAMVSDWLDARDLANLHRLAFSSGNFSPVSGQLMTTAPENAYTELLQGIIGSMDRFYSQRPVLKDGNYYFSSLPGLCIRFDWEKIRREEWIAYSKTWKPADFPGSAPRVF